MSTDEIGGPLLPRAEGADPVVAGARSETYVGFEAFVAEHGQSLMRYAWLITRGDEALSQDLVQSALLKMLEHRFEQIRYPKASARRLMANQHLDLGRHRGVQQRAAPVLGMADDTIDVELGAVDDRRAIMNALGRDCCTIR